MTIPPVTPYLALSDASGAIDFYKAAFGAEELVRHLAPGSGKIMHAQMLINGGLVMLTDDFSKEFNIPCTTPKALGGSSVVMYLHIEKDVDAVFAKAVDAGATVIMPLEDQFWGDRYGQVEDPYGHRWSISQPIQTMDAVEVEAAAKDWFQS